MEGRMEDAPDRAWEEDVHKHILESHACQGRSWPEKAMTRETEGLPRWCNGKESAYQCRRHRFESWVRK